MKNTLDIYIFVLTFWLDKKLMVNFKIYDVTTGQQITAIHILPNISRNKEVVR